MLQSWKGIKSLAGLLICILKAVTNTGGGSRGDYREDIRISKEILDRLTEAYRKIRNTCRFILGNLYDFDPEPSSEVDYTQALLEIDRWAMSRLQTLIEAVTTAYENFTFHEVFHALYT